MRLKPRVMLSELDFDAERSPTLQTVMRRQLMLIDQLQGVPMLMLLLAGGCVFAFAMPRWYPYNIVPLPMMLLASVAWAAVVWRAEPPSRRGYHRAAPVPTLIHDLMKVGAGAMVLSVGLAVVLAILTVAWYRNGLAFYFATPVPVVWLLTLTSCLLLYVLVSAIPMLTDRPLEWMLGIASGFALIRYLASEYNWFILEDLLDLAVTSDVGVVAALVGPMRTYNWDEAMVYRSFAFDTQPMYIDWIGAFLLWSIIAGLTFYCASRAANRRSV